MDGSTVAAVSALAGVLVGSAVNFIFSLRVKNHEWKLRIASENAVLRRKVYSEFLAEVQRLSVASIDNKASSFTEFNYMTAKFSEVQLVSSDSVVNIARKLCEHVVKEHAEGPEFEGEFAAVKAEFIAAARKDVDSYFDP